MTALLTTPSKFCQSLCLLHCSLPRPALSSKLKFVAYISMTPCELEHIGDLRVESGVFSPASYCIFPASHSSLLNHIFCQTGLFFPALLLTSFRELYFLSLLLHPQGENGSFSGWLQVPHHSFFLFLSLPIYLCFFFVVGLFLIFKSLFLGHAMWDLSSLTRGQTCTPCIGSIDS